MIIKIDIIKAAQVLTQKAIEHFYVDSNKEKGLSLEEIEELIYIVEKVPMYFDKNNRIIKDPKTEEILTLREEIIRKRVGFQPVVKEQADILYEQYFKTLKDIKNYN